jgi:uncharacterized membrane protein
MKSLWGTLLKGFVTILPLVITLWVVYWVIATAEALIGGIFALILPDPLYIPGMGIIGGILLLYALGLLMEKSGIMREISGFAGRQLERIPLVKTVYSSIQDLTDFISMAREDKDRDRKAVLATVGENLQLIGFITGTVQEQLGHTPDTEEEIVAVYLPMSYQVGGFTVYIPRSRTIPLDMGFEEATKLVLTAGVGSRQQEEEEKTDPDASA